MGTRLGRSQAAALMSNLISIRDELNRIIASLEDSTTDHGRQVRNYDVAADDPEVTAERFGVDLTPEPVDRDRAVPDWLRKFQERHP